MSEKKIMINPDLFKVDNSSSRKKKDSSNKPQKIKVKSSELTPAKSRSIKRNVLKIIRAKQQDEFKRLFSDRPSANSNTNANTKAKALIGVGETEFNTDFDNSLKYLSDLAEKETNKAENHVHNPHNRTFKQYPSSPNQLTQLNENVSLEMPTEFALPSPRPTDETITIHPPNNSIHSNTHNPHQPCHPGYGCLKNGSYPTYRTWRNQQGVEQKIPVYQPPPPQHLSAPSQMQIPTQMQQTYPGPSFMRPTPISTSISTQMPAQMPMQMPQASHTSPIPSYETSNNLIKMMQMQKTVASASAAAETPVQKIRNMRRKKIYKRTYRVGRSKVAPKISCLISNKTVRQKIQQSMYDLKHADMKTVRKFLLKKGFIRVGTVAPNDVLRKMYESVASICGDVENHNPDNLLFNFVNDKD